MTEHDVPEPASVAAGVVSDELVEAVVSDAAEGGVDLLGPDGVLAELTKRVLERALAEEMADHLGYEHGDPIGHGTGNNRNGSTPKQVLTEIGAVDLDVPRDRNARCKKSEASDGPSPNGKPRYSTTTAPAPSNGPTEGLNLSIKKIKRCGHGFRNFDNYRLRVLLHTGGINWPATRPPPPRIRTRSPHSDT